MGLFRTVGFMAESSPVARITYGGYLRLEELLALQDGPDGYTPLPSNDELHFIIVHQTFELWFKLILRELKEARTLMNNEHIEESSIPRVVHHLERVSEIFRLLADQWKVMETLSPQDFLAFRDRLGTSSGFESWQMRELEVLMGLESQGRVGGMDPLQHMKRLAEEGKVSAQALHDFETTRTHPSSDHPLNHSCMVRPEQQHGLFQFHKTVDEPTRPRQQRKVPIGFYKQQACSMTDGLAIPQ